MKRIVSFLLAIVLLLSCVPVVRSDAADYGLGMKPIGSNGYQNLTSSQKLVDMIKVYEGFSATAYWDYSQWTIGYGTRAYSADQVVTPAEAEVMLKNALAGTFEKQVNDFCRRLGKQPSQNQFDALVDFSYNLGCAWMEGSRLADWLKNPTTEMELVNAMGSWCRAGGEILFALTQRRIREAIMFLKNEYSVPYTPTSVHNMQTNIPVISNGALPYYSSVVYKANGGTINGRSDAVFYYKKGCPFGTLEVPTRYGYYVSGWKVTRINGNRTSIGGNITASSIVGDNLEITAQWTYGTPSPGSDNINKATLPFKDVPANAWYRKNVEYVYNNGLMTGATEDEFVPNGSMTRGMLVTVLYRIAGEPTITKDMVSGFTDINGKYYTDAVNWASHLGIVNGVSATSFAPKKNVTRQEAVVILYRFCKNYGNMACKESANLDSYKDEQGVSDYAMEAMQWAISVGLLNGSKEPDGIYLNPNSDLTRCQSAAILQRTVEDVMG